MTYIIGADKSIEVGQEATAKGALEGMIDGYLTDGAPARDDPDSALLHQPAIKDQLTLFTLTGLRLYLAMRYQEKFTAQALSVQLRGMGYQSRLEHVFDKYKKNRTTRIVWFRTG